MGKKDKREVKEEEICKNKSISQYPGKLIKE